MEYAEYIELQPIDDRDDSDAADLAGERRELALMALYSAAMLGLSEQDLKTLCYECGLTYRDLETYTPPILRREPAPDEATMSLPF